jgi:nucleoside-diphosphate-sugar epimerase
MKSEGNISNHGKVLITGGCGFIGGHVVRYFREQGINVSCLHRSSSNKSFIEDLDVKFIEGDILKMDSLQNAIRDVDTVIHIAGKVNDWGDWDDFYGVNVLGTLKIMQECKAQGIQNIILTGSISSYGEEHSEEIKSEDHPYNSHYPYLLDKVFPCKMNYYRDSKALATKEAIEFARKNDMSLTIIEPVWVYGENEFNTGFYEYLKVAKSGTPVMPGSKNNKFHVVYAKDLAKAYFLAYQQRLVGINRIIIGNERAEYMEQIYSLFCENIHFSKPKNLRKFMVYPIGLLSELARTLIKSKNAPTLTRGRVNMFYDNIEYSTDKAKELLGFTCDYSLEEGIKNTVEWYKKNNLI